MTETKMKMMMKMMMMITKRGKKRMMVVVIAVKRRVKERPRSRQSLPACLHQQTRLDGDTKRERTAKTRRYHQQQQQKRVNCTHMRTHTNTNKPQLHQKHKTNFPSPFFGWLVWLVWVMFVVAADQWMYLLMMSSSLAYVASGIVLRVPMMAPFIALCSG